MTTASLTDFSRGITDEYLDAPPGFSEKLDNFVINRIGKLEQRGGIDIYSSDAPQIPPGNQRIDAFHHFDGALFAKSGTKLYYLTDGAATWSTLAGQNGDCFKDSELGAGASFWEWRGHLYITPGPGATIKSGCRTMKVYKNSSSVWTAVQAGLPRAEDGTRAGGAALSANADSPSFIWFILFTREYTAKVDGVNVTFKDFGSPVTNQSTAIEGGGHTFQSLSYTNATNEHYDTAGMKVALYRTRANGTEPLFLAEFALGASIVDNKLDSQLLDPLYTNSDLPYNDPAPLAFYSDIVESYGWYYAISDVDSGSFYNTRIGQSQPNDPDSVPAQNYATIPGKLAGRGRVGSYPIAITGSKSYRIEGRYDALGGGSVRAVCISDSEGCVSADGVVMTDDGCYFPSANGFCFTDGLQVINLTKNHLRATYASLANKDKIRGTYDPLQKLVLWAVEWPVVTETSGKNNAVFVLDVERSTDGMGCFYTMSSGADFQPNALHYKQLTGDILVGEYRGYVLKVDEDLTTDLKVNTATAASTWITKGIVYDYRSAALSFGTTVLSKWVTKIYFVLKNLTGNLSFDLFSCNDDSSTETRMQEVRERTTVATGIHKLKRWFPKGGLRCLYKQVRLTKGNVTLFRSDDYALATVDASGLTALLASGTWPEDGTDDLRGHSIYFEDDSYTLGFEISVDSGDTLTLLDPTAALPTGSQKWVIKGYPKNEKFELHALSVDYEVIGENITPYAGGADGRNAT